MKNKLLQKFLLLNMLLSGACLNVNQLFSQTNPCNGSLYNLTWQSTLNTQNSAVDQFYGGSSPAGGCDNANYFFNDSRHIKLSPDQSSVAILGTSGCKQLVAGLNSANGQINFQTIDNNQSKQGVYLDFLNSSEIQSVGHIAFGSSTNSIFSRYNNVGGLVSQQASSNRTNWGKVQSYNNKTYVFGNFYNSSNSFFEHTATCYNEQGTQIWTSTIAELDWYYGYPGRMTTDLQGNVIFSGKRQTSQGNQNTYDVVLRKVNSSGQQQWQIYYDFNNLADYLTSVVSDSEGNIYFSSTNTNAWATRTGRLVKVNGNTGAIIFQTQISTIGGGTIRINSDGNIIVGDIDNQVNCYNPLNGSLIWSQAIQSYRSFEVGTNGKVFVVTNNSVKVLSSSGALIQDINTNISGYTTLNRMIEISQNGNSFYLTGERTLGSTSKLFVSKYQISGSPTFSTLNASICEGESYLFGNQSIDSSGVYSRILSNQYGCDSTITLNLTVNQPSATTETVTACGSYTWNGNSYTQSGTNTWTGSNAAGCDSVVTLNLTIIPPPPLPDCFYVYSLDTATCSWVRGPIPQPPLPSLVNDASACDSYTWSVNGQTYTSSGNYIYSENCVNSFLNLTINQATTSTVNATITQGSTYSFNGQNLTTAGTYTATLQNAAGCDSLLTLNLTVEPAVEPLSCQITAIESSVCIGATTGLNLTSNPTNTIPSYQIGDVTPSGGIVFYDKGNESNGWRYLEVMPVDYSGPTFYTGCYCSSIEGTSNSLGSGYENSQIWASTNCSIVPFNYTYGGYTGWYLPSVAELTQIYNQLNANNLLAFSSGGYWSSNPAAYGSCGINGGASVLNFNNGSVYSEYRSGYQGSGYARLVRRFVAEPINTILWSTGETTPSISVSPTETTTYSVTVTQGTQTCTSDVTITVNQPTTETVNASITEGESYSFNGQNLTTAGTYTASLQNAAGCDSVVTLNLTVEPIIEPLICEISASEETICAGSPVLLTVSNSLNNNSINNQQIQGLTFIGSYENSSYYIDNSSKSWTDANAYALSIGGKLLVINNSLEDAYVSALLPAGYYSIGLFQNTSSQNYSEPNGGWEWVDGTPLTYTRWGIFPQEPNNEFGVENFGFIHGPNYPSYRGWNDGPSGFHQSIFEFSSNTQTSILWSTGETTPSISVSPTETTTYSVTVTQGTQTCSSDVTITVNQPTTSTVNASITEGESYSFNGQNLTTAGTYSDTLQNEAGCDLYVTLNLTVSPAPVAGCYAATVVNFSQGQRADATNVSAIRSNAELALGMPEAVVTNVVNFVSLGFGGSITLAFETPIANGAGNDVRIDEATWGNNTCNNYPEKADVFASQDGANFIYLGRACQDASFDLGVMSWAKYIRMVDVSDLLSFNADADGFDVNGIECLNGAATSLNDDGLVACTLQEIVNYAPNNRKNGTAIPAPRNNANNALGAPQSNNTINFVALGFGGSLVAKFDYVVFNQPGNDIRVTETSFGNPSCNNYPEKALVSVSIDNVTWTDLGEICQDGEIDLSIVNYAQYIKIQDASPINSNKFNGAADGYDVDAVVVLNNGCGTSSARIAQLDNTTTPDASMTISAFPNPMEDYTIVNFEGLETETDFNFQLMDAAGRLIRNENIHVSPENPTYLFTASELARGIYQIVVSNKNDNQVIRLVK